MKPSHLSVLQSQLWLTMADHCCRSQGVCFDQAASSALIDVSRGSGVPFSSLTLPQLDRLLLFADRQMRSRAV